MKNRYKLLIVVAIGVLIAGLYFVDVLIADRYDIELVQMTPETVPADGQTSVESTLRVTRNGEVKSGHTLYGLSKNGGGFKSTRLVTDQNGEVTFLYYPYLKTSLNTLTDVVLKFTDESNSIFVSVPATKEVTVKITEPNQGNGTTITTDDIFG